MSAMHDVKPKRQRGRPPKPRDALGRIIREEAGKRPARALQVTNPDRPMISVDLGREGLARLDAYRAAVMIDGRATAARRLILEGLSRIEAGAAAAPPMGPMRRIRCGLALACGMVPPAKAARIGRILASRDGAKPGRKG